MVIFEETFTVLNPIYKWVFELYYVKLKSILMLTQHLNLFHTLKLSIKFYYMNEILYLKSVKIIANIKSNGKKNKRCGKLFLNREQFL